MQGTYETFAECARKHFDGSLAGRLTVTAGLGGMGGAQPLAVTMNDGLCLAVEVDPWRIQRRVETGYCDHMSHDLDEAPWADGLRRRDSGLKGHSDDPFACPCCANVFRHVLDATGKSLADDGAALARRAEALVGSGFFVRARIATMDD